MLYKYTNLIASWTYSLYTHIVYIFFSQVNLSLTKIL